jgi:hypothetical protein
MPSAPAHTVFEFRGDAAGIDRKHTFVGGGLDDLGAMGEQHETNLRPGIPTWVIALGIAVITGGISAAFYWTGDPPQEPAPEPSAAAIGQPPVESSQPDQPAPTVPPLDTKANAPAPPAGASKVAKKAQPAPTEKKPEASSEPSEPSESTPKKPATEPRSKPRTTESRPKKRLSSPKEPRDPLKSLPKIED